MPPVMRRRTLLGGLAAGLAATAAPVRWFDAEAAAAPAANGVFGYGVASGDPTPTSVIIWTRATPSPDAVPGSGLGSPIPVTWQVARDAAFTTIVATGTVTTSPASDHTVKVDVLNLSPYTRYVYRFIAGGETSRTGTLSTAPPATGADHALRIAFVSCSNYTGGYFTAYRGIASRDDLDFVLHLGDYIYEYGEGPAATDRYGPAALAGVRDGLPLKEIESLADYRTRHALHKADPDLQAVHAKVAWITTLDDHEVANNQWANGAEDEDATDTADIATRRANGYQAYLEWMPIRPAPTPDPVPHDGSNRWFRAFSYGTLADLTVLETRQNRSQQIDGLGIGSTKMTRDGGFIPMTTAGLADATRHLPEPKQLQYLTTNVTTAGHAWHLVGNNVVFTRNVIGGMYVNSDAWDGYQADQSAFITSVKASPLANGDVVLMTGDIHSSWVFDVPADTTTYAAQNNSVMVEFVGPSITSDGFSELLGGATQANAFTTSVVQSNPWLKKLDGVGHGYCILDVTRARVQCDWWFITSAMTDPRVDPDAGVAYQFGWQTLAGSRKVSAAPAQLGARTDSPAPLLDATPPAALPEHVGPVAVAGTLAVGAAIAWSRRRAATAEDA